MKFLIQRGSSKSNKDIEIHKKRKKVSEDPKPVSPSNEELTNEIIAEIEKWTVDDQRKESFEFGTLMNTNEQKADEKIDAQMEEPLII